MNYIPLVEVTRGSMVESVHHGALAVADARGNLVAHAGDPRTVAFLRSTAKPLQALQLVETGAAAHFRYSPKELALTCASHTASAEHLAVVRGLHARLGIDGSALLCGAHIPSDPAEARRLADSSRAPTPLHNNCSGKHTGMVALALFLCGKIAAPGEGETEPRPYVDPQHPIQRLILQTVAGMAGLAPGDIVVGVDGCSAPTFALPLVNAATALARLMDPAGLPFLKADTARTITSAMAAHPEMVSAPGGFDTELMRARPGMIISKGGAEGYLGLGLAPGALGAQSPALGLVMKIADGNHARRALGPVALEALRQLGALQPSEHAALAEFLPRPVTNWREVRTGEARTCFELERDGKVI